MSTRRASRTNRSRRPAARRLAAVIGLVGLPFSAGCGSAYEIGEVEGRLLIDGAPAHKVRIEFMPDVGRDGPGSTGATDAEGRFVLRLNGEQSQPGALVGDHRVVLSDLQLSESPTGAGLPIRVPPDYTMPSSTPMRATVKPGKQQIDLGIP